MSFMGERFRQVYYFRAKDAGSRIFTIPGNLPAEPYSTADMLVMKFVLAIQYRPSLKEKNKLVPGMIREGVRLQQQKQARCAKQQEENHQ
jgi:hypothetical protein